MAQRRPESFDMTIVANSSADAFIRRLPKDMQFFLVYGYDEGLIHDRTRQMIAALLGGDNDPMRLARIDGDAALRDPGAVLDEALEISMFGGDKVIWIEMQSRDVAPLIAPLAKQPPAHCSIVVEAGPLKKGAPLRSLFERMERGVAIECYADDRRALGALIEAEAREAGLRIAPDARDLLASLLGADRMTTRSEIAKLMLYAQGGAGIGIADVEAIIADAAPDALDDVVDSAFSGEAAAIEASAGRFFREGGDAALLMLALVRRLLLLHRIVLEISAGARMDSVLQMFSPRLPPGRKSALERQAARWSAARLGRLLTSLQNAAGRVRRHPKMAEFTAMRALWALGSSVRGGAG
jgi:DNA polymerase III subunit delta